MRPKTLTVGSGTGRARRLRELAWSTHHSLFDGERKAIPREKGRKCIPLGVESINYALGSTREIRVDAQNAHIGGNHLSA